MNDEERRRRVERVREAAARLRAIESKLTTARYEAGVMEREVRDIRETLENAVAPPEENLDTPGE